MYVDDNAHVGTTIYLAIWVKGLSRPPPTPSPLRRSSPLPEIRETETKLGYGERCEKEKSRAGL